MEYACEWLGWGLLCCYAVPACCARLCVLLRGPVDVCCEGRCEKSGCELL